MIHVGRLEISLPLSDTKTMFNENEQLLAQDTLHVDVLIEIGWPEKPENDATR